MNLGILQNKLRVHGGSICLAALLSAFYWYYHNRLPDWDEPYYEDFTHAIKDLITAGQLPKLFSLYETEKFSGITSLPGFFVVTGYLNALFPFYPVYRAINVVLLFISGLLFDRCRKTIYPETDPFQKWAFVFFPVSFTLGFLIYTDFPALFLVLLAFFFELKGSKLLSAFALFVGFFVRQSIAPWIVIIPLLSLLARPSPPSGLIKTHWQTFLLLLGVMFFVKMNHGFSMGDRQAQATGHFSLRNVVNFYFFSGVFFIPSIFAHLKKRIQTLWKYRVFSFIALFFSIGIFYQSLLEPLHPYNGWLQHRGTFFIRNWILKFQSDYLAFRLASFVLVFFGALELNQGLSRRAQFLLTLSVGLSLLPFNVVDIRYAIIPFMFYLLFRQEKNSRLQMIQSLWLILVSVTWFVGVRNNLWTPF